MIILEQIHQTLDLKPNRHDFDVLSNYITNLKTISGLTFIYCPVPPSFMSHHTLPPILTEEYSQFRKLPTNSLRHSIPKYPKIGADYPSPNDKMNQQ
jgi:hypothetical protein